jgi:hypothetical protein
MAFPGPCERGIEQLPCEVLAEILVFASQYLYVAPVQLRTVSRQWHAAIVTLLENRLTEILGPEGHWVIPTWNSSQVLVRHIFGFMPLFSETVLDSVHVIKVYLWFRTTAADGTAKVVSVFAGRKVRWLDVRFNGPLAIEGVRNLAKMGTSLKRLDFPWHSSITDDCAELLAQGLPQLEALSFRGEKLISNSGLQSIVYGMAGLKSLGLRGSTSLTPGGLSLLAQLLALESLNLSNVGCVTDETIVQLRPLVRLRSISVSGSTITDAGLIELSGHPLLQKLDLNGCHEAVGAELSGFRPLPELEYLCIRYCLRTLTGHFLQQIPNVRCLRVNQFTKVTDATLHLITESLPLLEELVVDSHDVTDAGLGCISSLTNLRYLSLTGRGITDKGLKVLSEGELTKLNWLVFDHCERVTDGGIKILVSSLPQLEYLNLEGCDGLTDALIDFVELIKPIQHFAFRPKTEEGDNKHRRLWSSPKSPELETEFKRSRWSHWNLYE